MEVYFESATFYTMVFNMLRNHTSSGCKKELQFPNFITKYECFSAVKVNKS